MAFKRFLNQTAFNRAKQLTEYFTNWQSAPGCIIHLRPGNTVAFYYLGQKALELGKLGATDEYTKIFQRQPVKGVDAATLTEQLKLARRAVIDDIKKNKKAESQPARQAALAWELLRRNKEYVLIDEQVQVPHEMLTAKTHEETRVDLLALERATGQLALLTVKPAEDNDLDGPVLEQLRAARALPAALKGGEKIFIQHYQQLFAQKTALNLVGGELADIKGIGDKALIITGEAAAAYGRLACLPTETGPAACALLPAGAVIKEADFRPLAEHLRAALAGPRAAYAPRKPRVNPFTKQADAEQDAWAAIKPRQAQLGGFDNLLAEYSKKNGLSLQVLAKHPRSSQTACAQALAPVFARNSSAITGLINALNAAGTGLTIETIDDCHFEVPHAQQPGQPAVLPQADIKELTGETGRNRTGLDALLAVTGRRDGRPVRALVGIEFKYSEAEFACCAGFTSPGFAEPGKQACLSGKDRGANCCLRNQQLLPAFTQFNLNAVFAAPGPVDAAAGACALLGPLNQLYRSHYLTLKLKEHFKYDEALFLVLYDARNQSLLAPERPSPEIKPAAGPLQAYAALLAPEVKPTFAAITAQSVIESYAATITQKNPPWLVKIRSRYNW